jgi:DNA repair protein RadC
MGTIDGAAVYPRELAKSALQRNAAAVILGHNHPSGITEPSSADRRITERIVSALGLLDIRVLDHVIVSTNNSFSFAEEGLL